MDRNHNHVNENKKSTENFVINQDAKTKGWKINPERAIKNMKKIVILFIIVAGIVAFVIQSVIDPSVDILNVTTLAVGIVFGTFIAIVVYVYSKRQYEENKELQIETEKRIAKVVEQTSNEIVQKVVDIANAQLRVKEGGEVALRKEGTIGADIVRNINENISVSDSISTKVTRAKDVKPVARNIVQHSTDTFVVARNKKEFKIDGVLITEEQKQVDDLNKEIKKYKNQLLKLTNKKPKKTTKKKTAQRKYTKKKTKSKK